MENKKVKIAINGVEQNFSQENKQNSQQQYQQSSSYSQSAHEIQYLKSIKQVNNQYSQSSISSSLAINDGYKKLQFSHFRIASVCQSAMPSVRECNYFNLSNKMKGLVLMGLFNKKKQVQHNNKIRMITKWYLNTNQYRFQNVIDNFVTSGSIRKQKVFYMLKIMAKKQRAKSLKQIKHQNMNYDQQFNQQQKQNHIPKEQILCKTKTSKEKNKEEINAKKNKTHKSSHTREKAMVQINKLKSLIEKQQKSNTKSSKPIIKEKNKNQYTNSEADQIQQVIQSSINHILVQKQDILSCASQDNPVKNIKKPYNEAPENDSSIQRYPTVAQGTLHSLSRQIIKDYKNKQIDGENGKGSISNIDPASGELRIEMITCTNIFDKQQYSDDKTVNKCIAFFKINRIWQKVKVKNLGVCFRKLLQNLFQEDYQQQLLKAKRNLQLVQLNFLVQCQMESIFQSYQQQNQHLENIDKNLEILKQKFALSRTVGLIRILKKITYPSLTSFFDQLYSLIQHKQQYGQQQQCKQQQNLYQVHQLNGSATSLSNRGSRFSLNSEAEAEVIRQKYDYNYNFNGVDEVDTKQLVSGVNVNQKKTKKQRISARYSIQYDKLGVGLQDIRKSNGKQKDSVNQQSSSQSQLQGNV